MLVEIYSPTDAYVAKQMLFWKYMVEPPKRTQLIEKGRRQAIPSEKIRQALARFLGLYAFFLARG
jgi:hypothetical protein